MASTYLSRTFSSGNRRTFTISVWVKRTATGENNYILDCPTSSNHDNAFRISSSDEFGFGQWEGSDVTQLNTNAKLRDTNAWYHLVASVDTTQSTASDRVKLYINGELQTSFSTSNYPTQNFQYYTNSGNAHYIGYKQPDNARYFNGLMSHFHFIDGTAYDASAFGSTDSTTGEWKINTSPSVTYGNNGWFLFKDNASVTDQSGNSNNWTLTAGTLVPTQDNPSNVFCTLNALATGNSKPTFSIGNNRVTANATGYQFSCGTIAVPLTGKWYWEVKANDNVNGSSTEYLIGAVLESRLEASGNFAEFAADGITQYGSVSPNIGQNDIIGVSVDRTAATLKIYKNNSLILTKSSLPAELIYPMVTVYGSVSADANFGNGYFGGTAVSSAGTNASNNGIFEYDVIPSDANALSTKGLNL